MAPPQEPAASEIQKGSGSEGVLLLGAASNALKLGYLRATPPGVNVMSCSASLLLLAARSPLEKARDIEPCVAVKARVPWSLMDVVEWICSVTYVPR